MEKKYGEPSKTHPKEQLGKMLWNTMGTCWELDTKKKLDANFMGTK